MKYTRNALRCMAGYQVATDDKRAHMMSGWQV